MSKFVDFFGLKILRGETLEEVKRSPDLAEADLVEISSRLDSRQKCLEGKKHLGGQVGFWRPLKVSWRVKVGPEPIISQIRSKRARKQIRGDEKKLRARGIEMKTISRLDQSLFKKWFGLYCQKLGDKARGRIVLDQDWLKKKEERGKKVGAVLAFKDSKIIGGNLFYPIGKRLSVAYGVAERVSGLAGGLGLLLDYYSMVWAQESGYKAISLGQDTNLYGFHLSPGLLFYKAKLGFRPMPATKTDWATTYFLNFEKFSHEVLFFEGETRRLNLCVVAEEKPAELPYLPLGVSECQVLNRKEVLGQHRMIFA